MFINLIGKNKKKELEIFGQKNKTKSKDYNLMIS